MQKNTVLLETGPLSPGEDVVLVHHDGDMTATRAKVARLPESAAELRAALSRGGLQVWAPTPTNEFPVALVVLKPGMTDETTHRVIDQEREVGPLIDQTRYQLQDAPQ